jgi:hypothetical protein
MENKESLLSEVISIVGDNTDLNNIPNNNNSLIILEKEINETFYSFVNAINKYHDANQKEFNMGLLSVEKIIPYRKAMGYVNSLVKFLGKEVAKIN